jgi:hypothetical protein
MSPPAWDPRSGIDGRRVLPEADMKLLGRARPL